MAKGKTLELINENHSFASGVCWGRLVELMMMNANLFRTHHRLTTQTGARGILNVFTFLLLFHVC